MSLNCWNMQFGPEVVVCLFWMFLFYFHEASCFSVVFHSDTTYTAWLPPSPSYLLIILMWLASWSCSIVYIFKKCYFLLDCCRYQEDIILKYLSGKGSGKVKTFYKAGVCGCLRACDGKLPYIWQKYLFYSEFFLLFSLWERKDSTKTKYLPRKCLHIPTWWASSPTNTPGIYTIHPVRLSAHYENLLF